MSRMLIICSFALVSHLCLGQERFTVSGVVTDSYSNETLIGVTVTIEELETGTVTNQYGFFSITLPTGQYSLKASYLGFETFRQEIDLSANLRLNINLNENVEELSEIVVTDEAARLSQPQMSVSRLELERIREIPMVMGEADVVKSLILLPGVTSAGESASGFNVRGGAVDQNLVLLDEAVIFNSSHLFGFFSVFNPDAIKDVTLYKGGIPARYGGRVSSVLDIYQRDGNSNAFHGSGGIGAIASRFMLEGPIVENRTSFLAGGRVSYADIYLPIFDIGNEAGFYDINAKLTHKLDESNTFYLSGYLGHDLFSIERDFRNTYGNRVGNFRWNHLFSDRLFSNFSLIFSHYQSSLRIDQAGLIWDSGVKNINVKYGLQHFITDKLRIDYGLNNAYYIFNPGTISPYGAGGVERENLTKKTALESAVYVDIEQEVLPQLTLNYGMRFSYFVRLGQRALYRYQYDDPLFFDPFLLIYQAADPIAIERYNKWGKLATFSNWEPRFAAAYSINSKSSIKASFTRMAQYLHLLSNTNSPTPVDVWTPSGPYIKPQIQDQYALGYFRQINNNKYALEVETFYKNILNRLDYIDGADLITNDAIEGSVLNGKARAYGLEFLLRKNQGRFTGWLAYTLSRSIQRTPGRVPRFDNGRSNMETGINLGKWYNTPFDKRHDLSLLGVYKVSPRWSISGNFVYQSGQPTNYPIGQFEFQGLTIPYYGERNVQRLPDYHRLDFSVTYTQPPRRSWESEWVFSVYNVYNRLNAASIFFRENQRTGENQAIQTSIFGIVPSISYNFKF